jgi:hypothetical protein
MMNDEEELLKQSGKWGDGVLGNDSVLVDRPQDILILWIFHRFIRL